MAVATLETEIRQIATTQAPTWKKRADLQGLRGLAVLIVVIYHTGRYLPGGYIGVDVFFVLSGFVITGMVISRLESPRGFSISDFYLRRVVRLLPALALMLSVVAVATPFAISPLGPQEATSNTGRAASLFHANIELTEPDGYFSLAAETNPLLHTWSLSVEEQFYLVFPALLLGIWFLGRGVFPGKRSWMPVALTAIAIPSFYLALRTTSGGLSGLIEAPEAFAFYSSLTRAWEFLAGAVLVLLLRHRSLSSFHARLFGFGGLSLIVLGSMLFNDRIPFPGTAALVPVVGTCLLIAGGQNEDGVSSQLLSSRPLVWLGDRSYSWYLWHWPAIVFARSLWPALPHVEVIAAILSIVPSALVFSHFENPIRFANRWNNPRNVAALGAVCIFVPIGLFSLTGFITEAVRSPATSALIASQNLHADQVRGCSGDESLANKNPSCLWPAAGSSNRSIVLLGDSNAGHFVEGLAAAAQTTGYDFIAATRPQCLFVDLASIRDGEPQRECNEFVANSIDDLLADPPDIVFISSSSANVNYSGVTLIDPVTQERLTAPREKAALYSRHLRSTVRELVDADIRVVLVDPIPHIPEWDPVRCGAQAIRNPLGCDLEVPREPQEFNRSVARGAVRDAVAGVEGATAIDFIDDICTPDSCSAFVDGTWIYRDNSHLSVQGSLLMAPRFEDAIRAAN